MKYLRVITTTGCSHLSTSIFSFRRSENALRFMSRILQRKMRVYSRVYVPFEITDSGMFSFLACEKASSGLNLFFADTWSAFSSNFFMALFCFSAWSRSFVIS